MLLSFVLLFTSLQTALAAQCCGYRGDMNEAALWQARQNLCQNPWSNKAIDGGYEATNDGGLSGGTAEYVFWGLDSSNNFANCWSATGNMITQCARSGYGAASWSSGSETYAMSATSTGYKKRDSITNGTMADVQPLPEVAGTLTDLRLSEGTYEVLGVPVDIHINGISLDGSEALARRDTDPMLNTTYGPTTDYNRTVDRTVDLSALIKSAVAQIVMPEDATGSNGTLSRRDQRCQTSGSSYAMVDAGYWSQAWELSSGCMYCGQNAGCSYSDGWSKTWSQTFSIGLSGQIQGEVSQAAWEIGFSWQRSWTRSNQIQCTWNTGVCHTYWTQQQMFWQRGFVVNSWASESSYAVWIDFIHADAPQPYANAGCDSGCCGGAANQCNFSYCKYAGNNKDHYGVCNNWDASPPTC